MRLLLAPLLVLVIAAGLAWLVPPGSEHPTRPATDAATGDQSGAHKGPLLQGNVSATQAQSRTSDATVAHADTAANPPGAVAMPSAIPGPFNGHATLLEMPRAPGRDASNPSLGDTTYVPVITRGAFLELADFSAARSDTLDRPWWADRRGSFGGADSVVVSLVREEAEIEVRLEEPEPLITAVIGVVVNEAGEPVPGATVVVYSAFYERNLNYGHRIREVGQVTTDAEGRFDLRPISLDTVHFGSNGEVVLSVSSAGLGDIVTRRLANIRPEVENDLGRFVLAQATCTLQGRIIDRGGDPVVDASIRVSGSLQPTLYDKRERMVFLRNCPIATTDADGRYVLDGFAPDDHFISIHVNIDSPWTEARRLTAGTHTFDFTIRAGGSVRGTVVDEHDQPLPGAIVTGGENYTHTLEDGTFWLDNVAKGTFSVHVSHHQYRSVIVREVASETDGLHIALTEPLPRLALRVVSGPDEDVVPIIAVDWTWPAGQPPNPAVPASPYWHDAGGVYSIPMPERARSVIISAGSFVPHEMDLATVEDGVRDVHMQIPPPVVDSDPNAPETPSDG